jgi:ribosomal protein S18 acetylase RimI-like enzyme
MTDTLDIRPATPGDLAALDTGLRALSRALGDTHRAEPATLERALFGPAPAARACLATAGDDLRGVVLFSPLFSTARGVPGLFVSDLWVAPEARGQGLGARLLSAAAAEATALWGAGFLRLVVHDHNPRARAFYDRLGFETLPGETALTLPGPAFETLMSTP